MRELNISVRKSDLEKMGCSDISCRRLGGVAVYGPSIHVLDQEIEVISAAINHSAKDHLSLAKNVLGKLTREGAGLESMEKRLFGSILGRQLRFGHLDSIVCASISGAYFRVYVHYTRLSEFHDWLGHAKSILSKEGILEVMSLEKTIFGVRRYNTWSSSAHILSHLVYIGTAEYVDEYSVRLTPGFCHAICQDR